MSTETGDPVLENIADVPVEPSPDSVPTSVTDPSAILERSANQPSSNTESTPLVQAPASLESAFLQAKAFLKQQSSDSGEQATPQTSLYDHLTQVLSRLLHQRPRNALEVFETVSDQVKQSRVLLSAASSTAVPKSVRVPINGKRVESEVQLLRGVASGKEIDSATVGDLPDFQALFRLFEVAGVRPTLDENIPGLKARQLVRDKNLKSVRLFGKLQGTSRDYWIVESEMDSEARLPTLPAADELSAARSLSVPPPVPIQTASDQGDAVVDSEIGTGVNKYVYWVCHFAGDVWVQLPDVLPKQIQQSRAIRKMLTGDLNKKIVSHPPFDGIEAQYLRAIIARICAGTVISPIGYYRMDSEAEDDSPVPPVVLNEEFEWSSNDAFNSLDSWVHHIPYILPQGRTVFSAPKKTVKLNGKKDDDAQEEAEDGDLDPEMEEEVEPESGPSILSPVADDSVMEYDIPSWSLRNTTLISGRFSPILLRSNRWPGAYAVGYDGKFANMYVGWGFKDVTCLPSTSNLGFWPGSMPALQNEYDSTLLVEKVEPSVSEEQEALEKEGQDPEQNADDADEVDEAEEDA